MEADRLHHHHHHHHQFIKKHKLYNKQVLKYERLSHYYVTRIVQYLKTSSRPLN